MNSLSALKSTICLIGVLCANQYLNADAAVVFSHGKMDGSVDAPLKRPAVGKEGEKVLLDVIPPGGDTGAFLGAVRSPLLFEIGLIRIHDEKKQRKRIELVLKKNGELRKRLKKSKRKTKATARFLRVPRCSYLIKYDNHKIANYELNEPYVRLTIPIPALWNEETENEFTIINTGDYKFGIDYVQIRGWDYKNLRKLTLALKDAELYPRNVANCFNASYATPANRAEALGFLKKNSSIGKLPFLIFNDAKAFEKMFPDSENMTKGFIPLFRSFETAVKPFDDFRGREYLFFGNYRASDGTPNAGMGEILLRNLRKGADTTFDEPVCEVKADCGTRSRFQRKNIYYVLSSLLAAPSNSFNTIFLKGRNSTSDFQGTIFRDARGTEKPLVQILPFIKSFFGENRRFLPVMLLPSSGNDPIPRDLHIAASLDAKGEDISILGISRYGFSAKLLMPVPWSGETKVTETHSEDPDKPNPELKRSVIQISSYTPFVTLKLPPNSFHFVNLRKASAPPFALGEFNVAEKRGRPESAATFSKAVPEIIPAFFERRPPPVMVPARLSEPEPFGPLKDEVVVSEVRATVSKIDGIRNVVPYSNDGELVLFKARKGGRKDNSGVHFPVVTTALQMRPGLRGLGFWIRVRSARRIGKVLRFEYDGVVFTKIFKPGKWFFCLLPVKRVHSTFFSLAYPTVSKELSVEMNGVHWLFDSNAVGDPNGAMRIRIAETMKKRSARVIVSGVPSGYCEIRKRVALGFSPNRIVRDTPGAAALKIRYFPKSAILVAKGVFPPSKRKFVDVEYMLSRVEPAVKKKKSKR